ncbi:hypothetical protein FOMPIDRAFT_1126458, partial [Fomitopsis schrenkii]
MNGRGNLGGTTNNKWNVVNQVMRENKIGILALQETHMDEETVERVHQLYGRRIHVAHSQTRGTVNAGGVAFALNRELVNMEGMISTTVIEGRALHLSMNWHGGRKLTLLNVYAPNNASENANFWTTLGEEVNRLRLTKPDTMMGDCNLVEEAIDRLPVREDNQTAVDALRDLLRSWGMTDGWRMSEPKAKEYTYPQRGSETGSRIDRIYVTENLMRMSEEWNIETTAIPTDHKLCTVRISAREMPYIGKGRWVLPHQMIQDNEFIKEVEEMGRKALEVTQEMAERNSRTDQSNPQTVYRTFKQRVKELAQKKLKERVPKLKRTIQKIKDE